MEEWIKLSIHNLDQLLIKNKRESKGGKWRPKEGARPLVHTTRGRRGGRPAAGGGGVAHPRAREREGHGCEGTGREEEKRKKKWDASSPSLICL